MAATIRAEAWDQKHGQDPVAQEPWLSGLGFKQELVETETVPVSSNGQEPVSRLGIIHARAGPGDDRYSVALGRFLALARKRVRPVSKRPDFPSADRGP